MLPCETYAPAGCVTSIVSSGVKVPWLENRTWKQMVHVAKDRDGQGNSLRCAEKEGVLNSRFKIRV